MVLTLKSVSKASRAAGTASAAGSAFIVSALCGGPAGVRHGRVAWSMTLDMQELLEEEGGP